MHDLYWLIMLFVNKHQSVVTEWNYHLFTISKLSVLQLNPSSDVCVCVCVCVCGWVGEQECVRC